MPEASERFAASFLSDIQKRFRSLESLGWSAIEQVPSERLSFSLDKESNSIEVIVQHLHGNMLSRWTDFLTSDGEKVWRKRDKEFEVGEQARTREQLSALWKEGWQCTFAALNTLTPEKLSETILIRGQRHLVSDACLRQLSHYAYHIGQIVILARHIVSIHPEAEWTSLSIPRGQSLEHNIRMGYDLKKP